MADRQYDPGAELKRLIGESEGAPKADMVVVDKTTNIAQVKKRLRTGRFISKALIDFTLNSALEAERNGLDTTDHVLLFKEVNASETADVSGFIIHPIFDDDGEVTNVRFESGVIKMPINTPLFEYAKAGDVKVCRITGDAITKNGAYQRAAAWLFVNKDKYLIGNLKSEESILALVTREQAADMLGSDLGLYDNPFKPWLAAFGTPSRLVFKSGPEYIRVRIINDLKTKWGHKYHDGTMLCRYDVKYEKYITRPKDMSDEDYALYKEEKKKTQIVKSSHQVRWHGNYNDKETNEDLFFDAVKCKPYADRVKYFELCQEFGFDPYEADAIMTVGNFKSKTHTYEHGEVLYVPTEIYRVIGLSSKSGKSSVGAQAICLDLDTVKDLFKEKGMTERSQLFKRACNGDAAALEEIIQGQEEHSAFEDITIMWIINMLYAVPRADGTWGWPRFESNFNNVCVRLNRYFIDNVIKCRLSSIALYLEVNPKLDELEHQFKESSGSNINYVILPKKSQIRKLLLGHKGEAPEFKYLNIGRNPVVAQGNLQGVEILKDERGVAILNDSQDTIEISAALAHEMFGDQDGDKIIFAPSNVAHFPVYRSQLPHEEEKVKGEIEELSDRDLAQNLLNAAALILEAAMDTGILDYTRRQIYIEAMHKGDPITPQEGYEIGQICENAIQRMKKRGGKTARVEMKEEETVKEMLIKKFARGGSILPARMAHKEFVITKRHVDKRGKSERIIIMRKLEIINKTQFASWFPFNVAFDEIKGADMTVRHGDSKIIQEMFERGWKYAKAVIQQNKETYGFDIPTVTAEGEYINAYYRSKSVAALELEDEARMAEFKKIKVNIRSYIERLKVNVGEHGDRFLHHLALYLGTKSFGITYREGGVQKSRSGLALRVFPENILINCARLINPKNPWAQVNPDNPSQSRAERMIANLERKLKGKSEE